MPLADYSEALLACLNKDSVIDQDQAEKLVERSTSTGLPMDTLLLESGLEEEVVLRYLSQVLDIQQTSQDDLEEPHPAAVRLLPQRVAMRHSVLPLGFKEGTLVVATSRPQKPGVSKSLQIMVGLPVTWTATLSLRVAWGLHRLYEVPLSAPGQSMIEDQGWSLESKIVDGFEPLPLKDYESSVQKQWADIVQAIASADSTDNSLGKSADADQTAGLKAEALSEPILDSEPKDNDLDDQPAFEPAGFGGGDGDYSLAQASTQLEISENRDEVMQVLLKFARNSLEWAVFFAVQKKHLVAFNAVGTDVLSERLQGFSVSLEEASVLKNVFENQSQFVGKMTETESLDALYEMCERPVPLNAALFPVLLKGKPIGVLYGDCGETPVEGNRLTEITMLLPRVSQALERIIKRKKKS